MMHLNDELGLQTDSFTDVMDTSSWWNGWDIEDRVWDEEDGTDAYLDQCDIRNRMWFASNRPMTEAECSWSCTRFTHMFERAECQQQI